jgi:hypothetical protein
MNVLRLKDSDTGESQAEFVDVPEGISLQVSFADLLQDEMISVILDQEQEAKLLEWLSLRVVERLTK